MQTLDEALMAVVCVGFVVMEVVGYRTHGVTGVLWMTAYLAVALPLAWLVFVVAQTVHWCRYATRGCRHLVKSGTNDPFVKAHARSWWTYKKACRQARRQLDLAGERERERRREEIDRGADPELTRVLGERLMPLLGAVPSSATPPMRWTVANRVCVRATASTTTVAMTGTDLRDHHVNIDDVTDALQRAGLTDLRRLDDAYYDLIVYQAPTPPVETDGLGEEEQATPVREHAATEASVPTVASAGMQGRG